MQGYNEKSSGVFWNRPCHTWWNTFPLKWSIT